MEKQLKLEEAFRGVGLRLRDAYLAIPKKYGKKIKAAGGRYEECRGHTYTRYVTLPCTAVDLLNELLLEFQAESIVLGNPTDRYMDLLGIPNSQWGRRELPVRYSVLGPKATKGIWTERRGVHGIIGWINGEIAESAEDTARFLAAQRTEWETAKGEAQAERERQHKIKEAGPELYAMLKEVLPFIGYEGEGTEELKQKAKAALAAVGV